MGPHLQEWLALLLRWAHILFGVAWIGNSFYFMWLDASLERDSSDPLVEGQLWMVHSGGFYQVQRRLLAPGGMPKILHWFKWEATFTWITGIFLLSVVYYLGGGILMVDPARAPLTAGQATAAGLGSLVVAWAFYDLLFSSPLSKVAWLAEALGLAALAGAAYELTQMMSGRAAFIHVGAMLGTIMVANVWMRILPAQRRMIEATQRGEKADWSEGKRAKKRSVHNSYLTLPVVFVMLSNHFPNAYGHERNWLILLMMMMAGAGARHYMLKGRAGLWALPVCLGLVGGAFYMTGSPGEAEPAAEAPQAATAPRGEAQVSAGAAPSAEAPPPAATVETAAGGPKKAIDVATVGSLHGIVRFTGTAPAPVKIEVPAECAKRHKGGVFDERLSVKNGALKNVFISIAQGAEAWQAPPAPAAEARLDQRGCVYVPHLIGVQVGQRLTIKNSDPFFHNVHATSKHNGGFNEFMHNDTFHVTKTFTHPELMVQTRCDVHPWMGALIAVVPNPWFAVTGENGDFEIKGLPPGDYVLEAWHETLGKRQTKVSLAPKGRAEASFSYP